MPADTPRRPSPLDPVVRAVRMILAPVASLKITVALFVLAGLLVFFGTLAQKGQGVWTVVDSYFYSWWVKVELQYLLEFGKIFVGVRPDASTQAWFPFPAGKTLGWLMVINLTAAHILQFVALIDGARKQAARTRSTAAEIGLLIAKRSGIFVLHGGVLLLLVGEYVTREFAVEQQMLVAEGGSANYAYETRNFELAFVDRSSPDVDRVAVLPAKKLREAVEARDRAARYNLPPPSARFSHPDLPVDVEVNAYFPNSKVRSVAGVLEEGVRKAAADLVPADQPAGTVDPAVGEAVELLGLYQEARKKSPDEPPLPLFERVWEGFAADHFKSAAGPEVRARIEAAVGTVKDQQQATAGDGLRYVATPEAEVTGVDTTQKVDLPAAYVTLYEKGNGNSLGIYLVSAALSLDGDPPQPLPGQTAAVELRPKRHYKDYTVHLIDFKFDRYVGTDTPKNYSSDIRLEDPGLNQDRHVTIRMNDPLRHRGDAIFQSGFTPDEKATILQVVSNPGWQIPYISCVLVGLGMLLHFGIKMSLFVVRAMSGVKSAVAPAGSAAVPAGTIDLTSRRLPPLARYGIPVASAVVAVLLLAAVATPRKPTKDRLDLQKLATLPVVDGGRVKPLDTVARVYLRQITHAEEASVGGGKKLSALQWFMDTATTTPEREDGPAAWQVFRIENEEVRSLLKLPRREGLRYSVNELRPEFKPLDEQAKEAAKVADKDRTLYQSKLLELRRHVELYLQVMFGSAPLVVPPADGQEWQSAGDARGRADEERFDALQKALPRIRERLAEAGLPPTLEGLSDEQKATLDRVGKEEMDKELPGWVKASDQWEKVRTAYRENDPKAFDEAVGEYRKLATAQVPASDVRRAELETFLNQSSLYYWCTVLYGVAGVASLVGFVLLLLAPRASQSIRRGVFWWLVVTFAAHTFTLVARMYLMDRPLVFVTNLYSSAVFIGWGVAALCLILELVYPIGFGNLVASVLGFITTIIAHNLATSGDTLEMMQAVLDTNFWLATHVTTVTLGYSATYAAGVLGLLYVALYVLPERAVLRQRVTIGSGVHTLTGDLGKLLGTLTYSVICFATLLSFIGTVLGGIWADQSWGRFWGWDPKENGAVLIVLWNALILHARWGGLVKERGMAVLAVGGIIVTTWSWFGTNQLGVGLHAYGFSNQLVRLCDVVWVAAGVAVLVGVLPWQWVYRGGEPAPPPRAERA